MDFEVTRRIVLL